MRYQMARILQFTVPSTNYFGPLACIYPRRFGNGLRNLVPGDLMQTRGLTLCLGLLWQYLEGNRYLE